MTQPVLYEDEDGIVTLTLNQPKLRNPISDPEMIEGLTQALVRIEADICVRVAILTGAGSAFS